MNIQNKVTLRTHWFMKLIAILGFALGVFFLYLWLTDASSDGWEGLLVFGFLGGLLWVLASSYIEMTDQSVLVQVPYGKFKINWDEVKHIETNGTLYAFIGDDKRVVISLAMASSVKKEMYALIEQQVTQRNILIEQAALIPQTHKNARIK